MDETEKKVSALTQSRIFMMLKFTQLPLALVWPCFKISAVVLTELGFFHGYPNFLPPQIQHSSLKHKSLLNSSNQKVIVITFKSPLEIFKLL